MNSFNRVDIHIFALILCIVMLLADTLSEKRLNQNRIFRWLILSTAAMLIADLLGVYSDGQPQLRVLSVIAETLLFAGTPIPPALWAVYVSYQLFQSMRRISVEIAVLAALLLPNAVLSLLSPATGLMFRISAQNVYERGPLFMVLCITSFLPIAYALITCIACRRRVSRQILAPMLLFSVPPVIASMMQILFYGISVIWISITISIFIVYISVQVRHYNLDHLTGVFNRRQFDAYLGNRIHGAKKGKAFSCIMLDIDNFKSINDTYGHVVGDEALAEAAQLLRSCIRSEDFLSRYAGDEFVIVLDAADKRALDQAVARIHARAAEYNKRSSKPFRLSFSVGCEICDGREIASRDQLIARIDALMYRHKNQKKEAVQE